MLLERECSQECLTFLLFRLIVLFLKNVLCFGTGIEDYNCMHSHLLIDILYFWLRFICNLSFALEMTADVQYDNITGHRSFVFYFFFWNDATSFTKVYTSYTRLTKFEGKNRICLAQIDYNSCEVLGSRQLPVGDSWEGNSTGVGRTVKLLPYALSKFNLWHPV